MRCPFCRKDDDKVVDTRSGEEGAMIRRRRECLGCGQRYTTHERLEELPLMVIKKSGARVHFDRSKLKAGLERAVEKRPVSMEQADELLNELEVQILNSGVREISSQSLGEMLMERLRGLDQVAYVRFASVYREFKAVEEFVREIDTISRPDKETVEQDNRGE